MGYSEFKSKFINQFAQYENIKGKLPMLKGALDKAVEKELPLGDNNRTFQVGDIYNTDGLKISYNSTVLMCKYSEEKRAF